MKIVQRVLGAFGYVKRAAAYVGATVSRLTADWILSGFSSADQALLRDFQRLRQRARERVRNDPLANRFAELAKINVVGETGMTLQSLVLKEDGEPDLAARKEIETAFAEWGRAENCSVDGRLSWIDFQKLAVETRFVDGEILIRLHRGRGPFGLQLELLDIDQLDTDRNQLRNGSRIPEIRYGVEVDMYGRPVAYYVHREHPAEGTRGHNSSERIPANQIIHRYKVRRPGQTRGVSELAAGILPSKMLDGTLEAELVALRTAATKMGFFVRDESSALHQTGTSITQRSTMEAEPGLMDYLPAGAKDFKPWDPQHPTTAFAAFVQTIQRNIAAAWGVAYHSLTGDVNNVNYTSLRAAWMLERDGWRVEHTWWKSNAFTPVFDAWGPMATLAGRVRPPGRDWARWSSHTWMARGWDWTDPLKDLAAAEIALRLGVESRSRIAANRGQDLTSVFENLKAEKELAESMGLELQITNTSVSVNLNPGKEAPDGTE